MDKTELEEINERLSALRNSLRNYPVDHEMDHDAWHSGQLHIAVTDMNSAVEKIDAANKDG